MVLNVHPWAVDYDKEDITVAALFGGSRRLEPMADWLHETLREPLGEYLPLNFRYDAAFHRFEALLALTYVDISKRQNPTYNEPVPLGRFAYLHKTSLGKGSDLSALRAEYDEQRGQLGPIESGLLEEPTPSGGGVKTVETVGYDFKVVEDMIRNKSYL